MTNLSRRQAIAALAVTPAARAVPPAIDPSIVRRHDDTVERYLKTQIADPASPGYGSFPADETGMFYTGTSSGLIDAYTAAFLCEASRFHHDRTVMERLRLAAVYLQRHQNAAGNIDLIITNFNSPPDTAFVVHNVGTAAILAKRAGQREILGLLEPFLRKAGGALTVGGIHTPNHRWVTCYALAQLNELFPDPAYVRRIDQWLAEGIDIDADGQYDERSTGVYNTISDRSLIVMAHKLQRPALLEPVRRNLESMLYLLHPGYEVVTEISHRQDQYNRVEAGVYWFSLQYMAAHDGDGRFAALARRFTPRYASLSALMEYPGMLNLPADADVPDNYERQFPAIEVGRVRRGPTSATLLLRGNSRFFGLRRGDAVINTVRFASAFFGKAQFVPDRFSKDGQAYLLAQSLEAGYYQPLDPPRRVRAGQWSAVRPARRVTELCKLEQSAEIRETANGFRLRLRSHGTGGVPLAVEINLREGGKLEGCQPAKTLDAWLLASGYATYRTATNSIRFGPGMGLHSYIQVRGAEPKLAGPSVYLCGYTPFDHSIDFELS